MSNTSLDELRTEFIDEFGAWVDNAIFIRQVETSRFDYEPDTTLKEIALDEAAAELAAQIVEIANHVLALGVKYIAALETELYDLAPF